MKKILGVLWCIWGALAALLVLSVSSGLREGSAFGIAIVLCFVVVIGLPVLVIGTVGGLIAMAVSGRRKKQPESTGKPHEARALLEISALAEFLRQAQEQSLSDDRVIEVCRSSGWSHADIQQARQMLSGQH
jgi:hypothetical protein